MSLRARGEPKTRTLNPGLFIENLQKNAYSHIYVVENLQKRCKFAA